jgi:hypothetical protein
MLRASNVISVCAAAALLGGCGGMPASSSTSAAFGQPRVATSSAYCPALQGGTGLLRDGDFSQAQEPRGNGDSLYLKGTVFAPGWEVSKGNIDFLSPSFWHLLGLCSVDLDGNSTGGITASAFVAKPGMYWLSSYLSANGACPPTVKTMKVEVDKQFFGFTWNTAGGRDIQVGDWIQEAWHFYARRLSTVHFISQDPRGSGCGIVLAGIAVTKRLPASAISGNEPHSGV